MKILSRERIVSKIFNSKHFYTCILPKYTNIGYISNVEIKNKSYAFDIEYQKNKIRITFDIKKEGNIVSIFKIHKYDDGLDYLCIRAFITYM